MNSQIKPIVTTDEYFEILNKQDLSPEDIIKKESYEEYIHLCNSYEPYVSPASQDILNAYNSHVMGLMEKEKTSHEEKVYDEFKKNFEQDDTNSLNNDGPVRKLAKAGYIDATIILAILLNIGFIFAMALLNR